MPKAGVNTDGIYGIRVNHLLEVHLTRLECRSSVRQVGLIWLNLWRIDTFRKFTIASGRISSTSGLEGRATIVTLESKAKCDRTVFKLSV